MNIQEVKQKIKDIADRLNTKEIYTILLILVVGFGSFGLGRLSKLQEGKTPIQIGQTLSAGVASAVVPPNKGGEGVVSPVKDKGLTIKDSFSVAPAPGGQLVASKTGTKYYFPWCGSAARISEANKVWFNSVEEAKKAGYAPAANCKGLK